MTHPLTDQSDAALLERYRRNGEEACFAELVRRHRESAVAAALRITRSRADAEDSAQEALAELAMNPAAVRSSVAGYLRARAVHLALNLTRSERRRKRREQAVQPAPHAPDADAHDEARQAVEALPEPARRAVEMHYLEGMGQEQIAAELGINQSTVSRRLQQGMRQLRERLGVAAGRPAALASRRVPRLGAVELKPCLRRVPLPICGGRGVTILI